MRSAVTLFVLALLFCALAARTEIVYAQQQTLAEHSDAFLPSEDESIQQTLAKFRILSLPQNALQNALMDVQNGDERPALALVQQSASLDLFRSLRGFDGIRSREAQQHIDQVLRNTDRHSHLFAEASLLSALEYYSHSPLRHEDVEAGVGRLEKLDDSAAIPIRIRAEVYFWLAEGDRALSLSLKANQNYARALESAPDLQLLGLTLFRRAELEEGEQRYQSASEDFLMARETTGSSLRLVAGLRRAALLRTLGDYQGVLVELRSTDSLGALTGRTAQFSPREFYFLSPLVLSMELHPAEKERVLSEQEEALDSLLFDGNAVQKVSNTFQLTSPFIESEIALVRGSALSELHRYDTASLVLQSGLTALSRVRDTVGSHYIAKLRDFLRDALEFEQAWALFRQNKYDSAATEFLSLAAADTMARRFVTHSVNLTLREQGRYADPFYEERTDHAVATLDPSILDQHLIDTTFFIYNDFPERSRFYAGVALARSGHYAKAEQLFVSLVQDKSVIYSSRARYQLGLIRFVRKNYVESASILEPLSEEASLSGAFSAFLMGEISYRKNEFERAEQYFRAAENALPDSMQELRTTAALERGLSLVALGDWKAAINDLHTYLSYAPRTPRTSADTARKIEALFWLGKSYFRFGELDSAKTIFAEILYAFPTNARAVDAEYNYAWCDFRQNDFKNAEPAFEKVIAMDSVTRYSYDALSRAGDSYYALNDYDDAIYIYNWAVDRPAFNDYRTTHALFQLGITRMREDSSRSAMNVFRYLIRKYPNSSLVDRAYFNSALAAYAINQNEEAEADVDRLVRAYPQSEFAPRALLFAAERASARNADPTAVRYYRRVIESYPLANELRASLFGLQDLYVRNNQANDAIAVADTFIHRYNKNLLVPEILLHKGEIEYQVGRWDASSETLRNFLYTYPKRADRFRARYDLALTEAAEKDTTAAIGDYQVVIRDDSVGDWAAQSQLELARIERAAGHREIASQDYQKAFDMRYYSMDASPAALAEYGDYLAERSMRDSAIAIFQKLADRYGIQTSAGAKAELRIAELQDAAGRHALAQNALFAVTSVRRDMLGGAAAVRLGEMDLRAGAWGAALTQFVKAKNQFALSDESEMRRLFGVAQAATALKERSTAIAALTTLLRDYNLSAREKERATQMMTVVNPAKKAKNTKRGKKGARR